MQGDDFDLRVATEGEAMPADAFLVVDGRRFRMRPAEGRKGAFGYAFRNLQRTQTFTLEGGGVSSADYRLEVLPNPAVLSFRMVLSYPAYTGRESETVVNLGDAAVPEASPSGDKPQSAAQPTLRRGQPRRAASRR